MLSYNGEWILPVAVSLVALAFLAAAEYVHAPRLREALDMPAMLMCFFFPEGVCYLPLVWYDAVWEMEEVHAAAAKGAHKEDAAPDMEKQQRQTCVRLGIEMALELILWIRGVVLCYHDYRIAAIGVLAGMFSVILAGRTRRLLEGRERLIHLRDESTEVTNDLKRRQRKLIERQDYELHLATLRERNRIAREIHDNVGHILTRSILQVGALELVHKGEPVSGGLHEVNGTLNEAMDSIRASVRDLHDESMDLEQSVRDALKELSKNFSVRLEYDLPQTVPRNAKYCLLAITKEAVANINHHCNGDKVDLVYREHPSFWQLAIDDNGTDIHPGGHSGIGLLNMEERVKGMQGQIHFSTEKGFGIMVTIPK